MSETESIDRAELIRLIESITPSAGFNRLGECWAFLRAGCHYTMTRNGDSVTVEITHPTFMTFECRADEEESTYHFSTLPVSPAVAPDGIKVDYTREELIDICRSAVVPRPHWGDRDTPSAQAQIGLCWEWLTQNKPFRVLYGSLEPYDGGLNTDTRTVWLEIEGESFYLPTPLRMKEAEGMDWY